MSTQSTSWSHGLIGCGRVAPTHLDGARHAPPLQLTHVCDQVPERAAAFASQWGLETAALERILADETIRSVSICTPHDTHIELAQRALASGKHVLIEKPPGLDSDAIARLAAEAGRLGLIVLPITQHRFDPLVGLVRALLDEGELGDLVMLRASLECVRERAYYADSDWRGSWAREGGSVLMNQGYHFIDMLTWLAGPVVQVTALMDNLAGRTFMETEDSLAAALRFRSGALGTVNLTGAGGGAWTNVLELFGSDGIVAFDLSTPARVHRLELRSKQALKHWRKAFAEAAARTEVPIGVSYYGTSHRAQFRALLAAAAGEADRRAADLEQARSTVELIQAVYRTAAEAGHARVAAPVSLTAS